jgi:Pyruvate/2-oxoacid:ferredoxin oxidoreductase gamma subunit
MLYGMTGGQHSALTPEGFHTSTTLQGNWVPAIDMEQLLAGCHGAFFERHLATDSELGDVIADAIAFPGFAVVEVLELCTGFGVPLNRMDGKTLRAMAQAEGHGLGVRIRRTDRRPYHEVYRERFPSGAPTSEAPRGTDTAGVFTHRVERPTTVVIAGSAGEKVQTAAAVLSQAAVLSGLHCIQKNDYPVTVGSGFSLSEVKFSPEPILFTGADAPDAVLIVSVDGLREVRGRGDVKRLAPDATVIADESVAAELPADRTLAFPFRHTLTADTAALGAVAVLVARSGMLESEALVAAVRVLAGKEADALEGALARAASLSA